MRAPEPPVLESGVMKRLRLPVVGLGLAAGLAGCGDAVRHEVTVSDTLRKIPVHSVIVLEPFIARKVKRTRKEDYFHMKPDRAAATVDRVRAGLTASFSASLSVDTAYIPDEATRAWAAEIGEDLSRSRIPISVEPHPLATEAVVLTGIQIFGWEHVEFQAQFLWFARKSIGAPKVTHAVKLQVILIDPRNGAVLMDALEGQEETASDGDEELLDRLIRRVTDAIVGACPVPEGARPAAATPVGVTPPPAPSPLPPTSPSGTTP